MRRAAAARLRAGLIKERQNILKLIKCRERDEVTSGLSDETARVIYIRVTSRFPETATFLSSSPRMENRERLEGQPARDSSGTWCQAYQNSRPLSSFVASCTS